MLTVANRLLLAGASLSSLSGVSAFTSSGVYSDYATDGAVDYITGDTWHCINKSDTTNIATVIRAGSDGTIVWQRQLSAATSVIPNGLGIDDSGNCYVSFMTTVSSYIAIHLAKYNSAGVIQWQRALSKSSIAVTPNGLIVDRATGNCYVSGNLSGHAVLAKYNNAGAIQWQREISKSTDAISAARLEIDASENIYLSMYWRDSGVTYKATLRKYNSSGTIQMEKCYNIGNSSAAAVSVDQSGNIYLGGYGTSSGQLPLLIKLDSSGVVQWHLCFSAGSSISAIATDTAGTIYVTVGGAIVAISSAGSVLWQKHMYPTVSALTIYGSLSTNGVLLWVFFSGNLAASAYNSAIATVSTSGIGTDNGTYGWFTYADTTLTTSAPAITSATTTLTDGTGTLTDAAGVLTDATGAMTSTHYTKG